jgi:hypothetical protein
MGCLHLSMNKVYSKVLSQDMNTTDCLRHACIVFLFLFAQACSPRLPTGEEQAVPGNSGQDQTASPTSTSTGTSTPAPTITPTPSPTPTATPSPTATAFICPGSPVTQLKAGISAYVSFYPPYANRVRAEPTWTTGAIIGFIQPGEVVDVLDGPVCANGVVWWQIQSREQNLTGWTVEGDVNNYWLIPQQLLATSTPVD